MSDEQESKERKVKFVFEYDPDYRLIPCNGVWGGLTPRGDFRMDFMVERQAIPDYVINSFDIEGEKLGKEIEREPRHLVRHLQVGILMSLDSVETLAEWLRLKLAEIERLAGSKNDSGTDQSLEVEK